VLPSNHMVVEAKINGKGPYRLIFDLGAPVSLLSNHAAEDAGAVDKKTPRGFFMGIRGEAAIRKLELGGLTADDVPVVVMDHPYLKALSAAEAGPDVPLFRNLLGTTGRPLEGIIGYTFWAHY